MEIKKQGSYLVVTINNGDSITESLEKTIRTYGIIDGIVSGFGYSSMLQLGAMEKVDPLFYNKQVYEELITINNITGFVSNRSWHIHMQITDKEFNQSGGHFIAGVAWMDTYITINVLKTE
ncbi:PCC domain-containing protein [Spiroplasma endosymbiont of Labia minor]|uniref:PCC domain-containing protein n=1 Tax=Spiroplasma endosymbiont of Labia minor TaxID=3066305 RepID=UPI0030CF3F93